MANVRVPLIPETRPAAPNLVMMPAMLPEATDGARTAVVARQSGGRLLSFQRRVTEVFSFRNAPMRFQPRLAMTAAMAFFSVALTLNMTGVKLSELRTSSFRPSSLRRTVADTTTSAVRSFQNMRVVYQVESRLEDLRNDGTNEERMHSASPYSQPGRSSQPAEPKNDSTTKPKDEPKAVPQGSSALDFPVVQNDRPTRKGV